LGNKKNVIWIFGDQHRGQMLRCNSDFNAVTPNIDNLALTGINFKNAVCGTPLCCPFRGSLLTGLYTHKCVPGHEYRLPEGQCTIANVFRENGYKTAYFGKWHLDGFKENNGRAAFHIVPPERRGGFEHWVGYENNNSQYDCWVHGGEGDAAFHYQLDGYETDRLTELLINYIKESTAAENNPFFAVLSVQPPHNPYVAPPEFSGKYNPDRIRLRPNVPNIPKFREKVRKQLANVYAMVENLDWNVGRVRDTLKKAGVLENTHILFFSDHGDMHGSHGQFHKMTPYEEALRIPFIISGAETHYNGWRTGETDIPINHVDIAPTTLGLCGIKKPEWMEGTDYSYCRMAGNKHENEPDSAYIQSVLPTGHAHSVNKPWRGLVTKDDWKYVCLPGMPWMLYNLNEDPYEQINMAFNSAYEGKRKQLNERLKKWVIDTNDDFSIPE